MKLKILIISALLVISSVSIVNANARGNYGDPPDYHINRTEKMSTSKESCMGASAEYKHNDRLYGSQKRDKTRKQYNNGEWK